MIERIYILCLIIIIKSEVWTITHCLGLGHETMVCAVCLSMFLLQIYVCIDRCLSTWSSCDYLHGQKGKRCMYSWQFWHCVKSYGSHDCIKKKWNLSCHLPNVFLELATRGLLCGSVALQFTCILLVIGLPARLHSPWSVQLHHPFFNQGYCTPFHQMQYFFLAETVKWYIMTKFYQGNDHLFR